MTPQARRCVLPAQLDLSPEFKGTSEEGQSDSLPSRKPSRPQRAHSLLLEGWGEFAQGTIYKV